MAAGFYQVCKFAEIRWISADNIPDDCLKHLIESWFYKRDTSRWESVSFFAQARKFVADTACGRAVGMCFVTDSI